jgi:hypothetical protein
MRCFCVVLLLLLLVGCAESPKPVAVKRDEGWKVVPRRKPGGKGGGVGITTGGKLGIDAGGMIIPFDGSPPRPGFGF